MTTLSYRNGKYLTFLKNDSILGKNMSRKIEIIVSFTLKYVQNYKPTTL